MSGYSTIKNQYEGYIAARKAVAKTNPGKVEIVYKQDPGNHLYDSYFAFDPEDDRITIHPQRNNSGYYVNINAEDIPGLIKALRDFFE